MLHILILHVATVHCYQSQETFYNGPQPGARIYHGNLRYDAQHLSNHQSATLRQPRPSNPPQGVGKLSITLARHGWMFLNGKHIGDIHLNKGIVKRDLILAPGDVLSIKIDNYWGIRNNRYTSHPHHFYGMAAWLQTVSKVYATGLHDWKAIKMSGIAPGSGSFKDKNFNSCFWPKPVVLQDIEGTVMGNAPAPSQLEAGARYIWAKDAGEFDVVLFRLVIGGEDCQYQ